MNAIEDDFTNHLNPSSLQILKTVYAEPELAKARTGERFQFLRMGYFSLDPDASSNKLIFNRTVTLRDTWVKGAGK
jgi:glutaminyl-tRNA synthetase